MYVGTHKKILRGKMCFVQRAFPTFIFFSIKNLLLEQQFLSFDKANVLLLHFTLLDGGLDTQNVTLK